MSDSANDLEKMVSVAEELSETATHNGRRTLDLTEEMLRLFVRWYIAADAFFITERDALRAIERADALAREEGRASSGVTAPRERLGLDEPGKQRELFLYLQRLWNEYGGYVFGPRRHGPKGWAGGEPEQ